jgi:tetratricopeptide (TPR) repeat protein
METLLARGQNQDRERALEILAALEIELPHDLELMKLRAMQMLQERTPESVKTAKETLETVVKLAPTAVDAHLTLINIATQEGEYEAACDSAIRALGLNPGNLALLSARGRIELILEDTRMAAELANLVLQKDPNHAEAQDLLVATALVSKDRGLLEQALALIEAADGYSTNEGLLLLRSRVLVAMERPQAALLDLEAYCQTEDGNKSVAAIIILANLHRLAGNVDQAEVRIEQAEQMDPNSQTVIHARLLWLLGQNRLAELAQISSAYISARQQNPNTLMAAAAILSASDSTELKKEGSRLYEHVVKLFPTVVTARLGLASTLYKMGEIERTKAVYQELLEQYPNNIKALNDLAWILQDHDRRYTDALELANRGLSLALDETDKMHLLDTRGTILSNLDRLADARIDFERLVELSQPDTRQQANALLQLGRTCAKLNEHAQAKLHLERALKIDQKINVFTTDERSEIKRITQGSGM